MKTKPRPMKLRSLPKSAKVIELKDLAKSANDAHRRTIQHGTDLLEAALECGSILNEAKEVAGHGDWLDWLGKHCPQISVDTAQRYMKIAREGVKDAKTISQAYRQIGITIMPAPKSQDRNGEAPKQLPAPNAEADSYLRSVGIGSMESDEESDEEPHVTQPTKEPEHNPAPAPKGRNPKEKHVPVAAAPKDKLTPLFTLETAVMEEISALEDAKVPVNLILGALDRIFQWGRYHGL